MVRVLFSAADGDWPLYSPHLAAAAREAGIELALTRSPERPAEIDYIVYSPGGAVQDFTPFRNLKAVLSLWAGVEQVVGNPTLGVPLCRMVDAGLTQGMVEWVTGQVLRYHLGLDLHITRQDGVWRSDCVPPLAQERRVGVLGLGALGLAVARTLAGIGFDVHGWSRSARAVAGITARAGENGLAETLAQAEILVALLPATAETENLLDARRLALLPRGARLINPGRGTLIDEAALIAALDDDRLAHATLDVFRTEPLPPSHPFWAHSGITVTPHLASATRPPTAARTIVHNIRRAEAGQPLLHVVDRARGY